MAARGAVINGHKLRNALKGRRVMVLGHEMFVDEMTGDGICEP